MPPSLTFAKFPAYHTENFIEFVIHTCAHHEDFIEALGEGDRLGVESPQRVGLVLIVRLDMRIQQQYGPGEGGRSFFSSRPSTR